jgi:hypothetical protein
MATLDLSSQEVAESFTVFAQIAALIVWGCFFNQERLQIGNARGAERVAGHTRLMTYRL